MNYPTFSIALRKRYLRIVSLVMLPTLLLQTTGMGFLASTAQAATLDAVDVSLQKSATVEAPSVPALNPRYNLDQCKNGGVGDPPIDPCEWVNGNLNEQQAHYTEGESVGYRTTFTGLAVGSHTLIIGFDVKHSDKHALDYLTTYDRIAEVVDPCFGVSPCVSGTAGDLPSPTDPIGSASFAALEGAEGDQQVHIWNGNITAVQYITEGDLGASQSEARIRIDFTAATANPVIAWGGHIASRLDWGEGESAGGINGSPYHMRINELDGTGGNQDRSLSAGAVLPPPAGSMLLTKYIDSGDASPDAFSFTINPDPNDVGTVNTTNGTYLFDELPAGTYTITEAPYSGYHVVSNTCTNVLVASGQQASCAYHNAQDTGMITFQKIVQGGGAQPDDWTFTISGVQGTFYSGDSTALPTGTYTVTENGPTGYSLTAVGGVCSDMSGNDATLTVTAQGGTCSFTNTRDTGTLTVVKHVINDNGGTKIAGDFTMLVSGEQVSDDSFPGDEQGTTVTLNTGAYGVDEQPMAGYEKTLGPNCSGSIAKGEHKTCTVTNNDIQPRLTVTKVVINDNGGTKVVSDFPLFVDGTPVTSGVEYGFDAGSYVVSETNLPDYTETITGDCDADGDVMLAPGDVKACTITNNDVGAQLTVIKHVVNDNGGTKVAGDFTMDVTGTNVSNPNFPGDEQGTTVTLDAGSYSVDEGTVFGYAKTLSANCSGTMALGEHKTCTVTNDDIQPQLTVYKYVINDNGGDAVPSDFTLHVNGINAWPNTFPGSDAGTLVTLDEGAYVVTEDLVPGYDPVYSDDCTGDIAVGETKTCIVTNNSLAAHLIVIKDVINDNGGTKVADDFTMTINGVSVPSGASFPGQESPGTDKIVFPGDYTVTETTDPGYADTYSADCAGSIALGQTKICTVTNDDQQARLRIEKDVRDYLGSDISENITFTLNGNIYSFSENSPLELWLNPGEYTFTEDASANYNLHIIIGDNDANPANGATITLEGNDEETLTFVNWRKPPARIVANKIVCLDESDLPDWGPVGAGPDITPTTAQEYVATHPNCQLVPDWRFQWGFSNVQNPGDNTGESLSPDWNTFGPTDGTGTAIAEIPDLQDTSRFWVREVWQNNYIPFASVIDTDEPQVSAEFYCHTDVLNYDNYDYIERPQLDTSYYCIGFNVLKTGSVKIDKWVDTDGDGTFESGNKEANALGFRWSLDAQDVLPTPYLMGDTATHVLPGNHTVSENSIDDYHFVGWYPTNDEGYSCARPFGTTLPVDINVAYNETTEITFCNARDTGTIVVEKNVVAPDGSTEVLDAHEFSIQLDGSDTQPISEASAVTYEKVVTGEHTIAELTDPNYELVSITGNGTIKVAKGETSAVTVVNKQKLATITLVKDVRAYDGSDVADTTVFQVTLGGTQKPFAEGSNAVFTVNPGTYTAVEAALANYLLSGYSPADTVIVGSNESKTITVTNTQNLHGITVTKTDSVDPVAPGAPFTYTLTWTVTGNSPVTNLVLTDTLPATVSFVSASNGGTASGTNPVMVTWNLGNHVPGDTGSVTVSVTAGPDLANATVINNNATLTANEAGPVSAGATTTVTAGPTLGISKSVNLPFANPGDQPTYSVTITNTGNDNAVNVTLTDVLPAGFTFIDGGAATKAFALGNLEKGKSVTTTYKVGIDFVVAAGTYDNLATAKADNHGSITAKAPLEVRIPVVLAAELTPILSLEKRVNEKTANPGDDVTYVVTIANSGNAAAEDVRLTDTLPSDFRYTDTGSKKRVWMVGTLLAGEVRTITYQATVGDGVKKGKHENTVVATSANHDPVTATASIDVRVPTVLGALTTTGASLNDYLLFLAGLTMVLLSSIGLVRLRKLPQE